jgi:hypothetical protein
MQFGKMKTNNLFIEFLFFCWNCLNIVVYCLNCVKL